MKQVHGVTSMHQLSMDDRTSCRLSGRYISLCFVESWLSSSVTVLCMIQIVVVAQNLPTSLDGYECRYTSAGFVHDTSVIQVDELSDAGNTALKCETPLSQRLPQFADQRGRFSASDSQYRITDITQERKQPPGSRLEFCQKLYFIPILFLVAQYWSEKQNCLRFHTPHRTVQRHQHSGTSHSLLVCMWL